jgi:hypothetical protein
LFADIHRILPPDHRGACVLAVSPKLLRPTPQFLVGVGGEAANTNQKNVSGQLRRPEPDPRVSRVREGRRGDAGGRCNICGRAPQSAFKILV